MRIRGGILIPCYRDDDVMMMRMRMRTEDKEEEGGAPSSNDLCLLYNRYGTARISIWDEPSISLLPREEVERLLALTTPPPSPLIPLSSSLPLIPSPPLPIPSPPPDIPTHIETPESCLPLRKRLRFSSPTPSYEVGESSAAGAARQDRPAIARDDPYSIAREDLYGFVDIVDVPPRCSTSKELDYGITDAWDDLVGAIDEIAPTTLEGSFSSDGREREARIARKAWGLSMDASDYACSDVISLHTMVLAQSALISELQSIDHRRQGVIKELWAIRTTRRTGLAIEFTTELMIKRSTLRELFRADNKRKSDDTARNNQNQQPNKRQNTRRAYSVGNGGQELIQKGRDLWCSNVTNNLAGLCATRCSTSATDLVIYLVTAGIPKCQH
ncbi:hypothetical protein Tco_0051346 [Tanacetum coccineum]